MDNLQKEEMKKINIEEKVKFYEQSIDVLDKRLDSLMEELNSKDSQLRDANSYNVELKVKMEALERDLRDKDDSLNALRTFLEGLKKDNEQLRI